MYFVITQIHKDMPNEHVEIESFVDDDWSREYYYDQDDKWIKPTNSKDQDYQRDLVFQNITEADELRKFAIAELSQKARSELVGQETQVIYKKYQDTLVAWIKTDIPDFKLRDRYYVISGDLANKVGFKIDTTAEKNEASDLYDEAWKAFRSDSTLNKYSWENGSKETYKEAIPMRFQQLLYIRKNVPIAIQQVVIRHWRSGLSDAFVIQLMVTEADDDLYKYTLLTNQSTRDIDPEQEIAVQNVHTEQDYRLVPSLTAGLIQQNFLVFMENGDIQKSEEVELEDAYMMTPKIGFPAGYDHYLPADYYAWKHTYHTHTSDVILYQWEYDAPEDDINL